VRAWSYRSRGKQRKKSRFILSYRLLTYGHLNSSIKKVHKTKICFSEKIVFWTKSLVWQQKYMLQSELDVCS